MYKIGAAKEDITAFKFGTGMLGYGMFFNTMEEIETPLYSRAFAITDKDDKTVFLVNTELCFISPSLKKGVIKHLHKEYPEVPVNDANLMLHAQHTHAGPGGFSFHGFYNMATPGFVIDIYRQLVEGIAKSIAHAYSNREEGQMELGKAEFQADEDVAFNRSLKAYNANPENEKLSKDQWHLGVDRRMTLLSFKNKEGKDLGSINWFGVHTTSMPNTNHRVSADNKGYAAQTLEDSMRALNPKYVAAFSQGTCGDVTPRCVYNPKLPQHRGPWEGKFPDDIKSAQYNGELQAEKAKTILNGPMRPIVTQKVDSILSTIDFSNIDVDPKFANGQTNAQTSPSCLGLAFMAGTTIDGPGSPKYGNMIGWVAANVVKAYEWIRCKFINEEEAERIRRKYRAQGNKKIIIETGERRILATRNIGALIVPSFLDESVHTFKLFYKRGALDDKPWTPQVLPLQIMRIGELAICGIPFEITTTAGRRLKEMLEKKLLGPDLREVLICPYANAYSGYITTHEEYQVQEYEGGHTVFGQWSLGALQMKCEELAEEFLKDAADRNPQNDESNFPGDKEHLNRFKYYKSLYAVRREKRLERRKQKEKEKAAKLQKEKARKVRRLEKKLEELAKKIEALKPGKRRTV